MLDISDFDLPFDANIPQHQVRTLAPGVTSVAFGHDKAGVSHVFFMKEIPNEKIAQETGVETYEAVEFIQYFKDKFNKPAFQVTDEHRALHSETYERWKKGQEAPGTKLSDWPRLGNGDANSLYRVGIFTVDQLAATNFERLRSLLPRWGKGLKELHERSLQHMAMKQGQEAVQAVDSRVEALEKANAELREQLLRLTSISEAKSEAKNGAPKRGAPKRNILITDNGQIAA